MNFNHYGKSRFLISTEKKKKNTAPRSLTINLLSALPLPASVAVCKCRLIQVLMTHYHWEIQLLRQLIRIKIRILYQSPREIVFSFRYSVESNIELQHEWKQVLR